MRSYYILFVRKLTLKYAYQPLQGISKRLVYLRTQLFISFVFPFLINLCLRSFLLWLNRKIHNPKSPTISLRRKCRIIFIYPWYIVAIPTYTGPPAFCICYSYSEDPGLVLWNWNSKENLQKDIAPDSW